MTEMLSGTHERYKKTRSIQVSSAESRGTVRSRGMNLQRTVNGERRGQRSVPQDNRECYSSLWHKHSTTRQSEEHSPVKQRSRSSTPGHHPPDVQRYRAWEKHPVERHWRQRWHQRSQITSTSWAKHQARARKTSTAHTQTTNCSVGQRGSSSPNKG